MARNNWWQYATLAACLAANGTWGLSAQQDPPQDPPAGATPAPSAQDPAKQDPAKAEAEVAKLIEQLGARLYKERRAAETELERIGAPALDALRRATTEHSDPEVQWRAQRLVERLAKGGGDAPRGDGDGSRGGLQPRAGDGDNRRGGAGIDATRDFLDRLQRDLGRGFPADDPEWVQRVREQLDRQMAELERMGAGDFDQFFGSEFGPGVRSFGTGTKVQITPDGVRVEVRERDEDGETETKVYEAPDLEAFNEQYPEVAERHGLRFDVFGGPRGRGGLIPRGDEGAVPPPDRRLGVVVGALHPAIVEFLGGGILVEEVQADTLAEALNVQPGDVVLEINDRAIRAVGDVAAALGAIDAGAEVTVTVNRRGHMKALTAEKPSAEEGQVEKAEEKQAPRGLQPRKR